MKINTPGLVRHCTLHEKMRAGCTECRAVYMRGYRQLPEQKAKRQLHHKEHYQARKAWYNTRSLAWQRANRYSENERHKRVRAKYPDRVRRNEREYRAAHPEVYREKSAYRRACVVQATPVWVDRAELRKIYRETPPGHDVDHIVPLVSDVVCGLHVPCNLQYLPSQDNRRKSNTFNG